jgi:hypothetical protein
MPLINRAAVTVTVGQVQIAAANPTRRRIWIQQTSANAIRFGDTGVAATTGIRLGQNERILIEPAPGAPCPTGAIFAIREGGTDGTVNVVEDADS